MPKAPDPTALVSEEQVAHVARLARLQLTSEEIARMAIELSAIVDYVRKLSELDTTDVPPTAHVQVQRLPFRVDDPRPSLPHDEALGQAPRSAHDGFAVPGFMEE